MSNVKLSREWLDLIGGEFKKPYMVALKDFLAAERAAGKQIYPRARDWFAALDATPPQSVRVVILGQDPYHGHGQAHGLCFSVRPQVTIPPSLENIYKELHSDLGIEPARHGYLGAWAQQGVLLLNAVLTVEAHRPASHQRRGWERFTDAIIAAIAARPAPIVFLLWGSYAQRKAAQVLGQPSEKAEDMLGGGGSRVASQAESRHLILQAPHPSPLSASRGFFGCRHFSQANDFLQTQGRGTIDWQLPTNPQVPE